MSYSFSLHWLQVRRLEDIGRKQLYETLDVQGRACLEYRYRTDGT